VLTAVGEGITPGEGEMLGRIIDTQNRLIEDDEMEKRVSQLEQALKKEWEPLPMTLEQRIRRLEFLAFGDDQETGATWPEIQQSHWAANPELANDDPRGREFLALTPRWKLRKYARLWPRIVASYQERRERKEQIERGASSRTASHEKPPATPSTCYSPVLSGDENPKAAAPTKEEIAPSAVRNTNADEIRSVSHRERELYDHQFGAGGWRVVYDPYRRVIQVNSKRPSPSVPAKDDSPANEPTRPAEPGKVEKPVANIYIWPERRAQLDRLHGVGRWRFVWDPYPYAVLQVDAAPSPSVPEHNDSLSSEQNLGAKPGRFQATNPPPAKSLAHRSRRSGTSTVKMAPPGSGSYAIRIPSAQPFTSIPNDQVRPLRGRTVLAHPDRKKLVEGETFARSQNSTSTTSCSPVLSGSDKNTNVAVGNKKESDPNAVRDTSAHAADPYRIWSYAQEELDREFGKGRFRIKSISDPDRRATPVDPARPGVPPKDDSPSNQASRRVEPRVPRDKNRTRT
jgi:hypothetical protein